MCELKSRLIKSVVVYLSSRGVDIKQTIKIACVTIANISVLASQLLLPTSKTSINPKFKTISYNEMIRQISYNYF